MDRDEKRCMVAKRSLGSAEHPCFLALSVNLHDISRRDVVLFDDIRDATDRDGLVASTEVIGEGVTPAAEACGAVSGAAGNREQGDVLHIVPGKTPFDEPAIPRGRLERHHADFAAGEL